MVLGCKSMFSVS